MLQLFCCWQEPFGLPVFGADWQSNVLFPWAEIEAFAEFVKHLYPKFLCKLRATCWKFPISCSSCLSVCHGVGFCRLSTFVCSSLFYFFIWPTLARITWMFETRRNNGVTRLAAKTRSAEQAKQPKRFIETPSLTGLECCGWLIGVGHCEFCTLPLCLNCYDNKTH